MVPCDMLLCSHKCPVLGGDCKPRTGHLWQHDIKLYEAPVLLSLIISQDLVGKIGAAKGYGTTEAGKENDFQITANMTIKDNGWCAEQLRANFSRHLTNKRKLQTNLHNGLNDQIICTRGEKLVDSIVKNGTKAYGVSD